MLALKILPAPSSDGANISGRTSLKFSLIGVGVERIVFSRIGIVVSFTVSGLSIGVGSATGTFCTVS